MTRIVKNAQDSAEYMKAQFVFDDMFPKFDREKAAFDVYMTDWDGKTKGEIARKATLQEKFGDKLPEFKTKKAQAELKAQLKAKHADKLK